MNKRKNVFVFVIIGVVLLCIIWIILSNINAKQGKRAIVKVSGETVYTLPLSENRTVYVDGKNSIKLKIIVEENSIYVEHSDCPDKICEQKGKISKTNENIVCLPAETVVEIQSDKGDGLDAIV